MTDYEKLLTAMRAFVELSASQLEEQESSLQNNCSKLKISDNKSYAKKKRAHISFSSPRFIKLVSTAAGIVLVVVLAFAGMKEGGASSVYEYLIKSNSFGTKIDNGQQMNSYPEYEQIEHMLLPDMPDRFKEGARAENSFYIDIEYTDGKEYVFYSQRVSKASEYCTSQVLMDEFEDGGVQYIYYETESENCLLWNDYGYSFGLYSNSLEKGELLEISKTLEYASAESEVSS